jgi:hypothetical protein
MFYMKKEPCIALQGPSYNATRFNQALKEYIQIKEHELGRAATADLGVQTAKSLLEEKSPIQLTREQFRKVNEGRLLEVLQKQQLIILRPQLTMTDFLKKANLFTQYPRSDREDEPKQIALKKLLLTFPKENVTTVNISTLEAWETLHNKVSKGLLGVMGTQLTPIPGTIVAAKFMRFFQRDIKGYESPGEELDNKPQPS